MIIYVNNLKTLKEVEHTGLIGHVSVQDVQVVEHLVTSVHSSAVTLRDLYSTSCTDIVTSVLQYSDEFGPYFFCSKCRRGQLIMMIILVYLVYVENKYLLYRIVRQHVVATSRDK